MPISMSPEDDVAAEGILLTDVLSHHGKAVVYASWPVQLNVIQDEYLAYEALLEGWSLHNFGPRQSCRIALSDAG
jgi:hypothetical protein